MIAIGKRTVPDPVMRRAALPSFRLFQETPEALKQIRPAPKPNRQKRRAAAKKEKRLPYEPPIANKEETQFRHAHWQQKRELVKPALKLAGISMASRDAFDNCGAEAYVEYCREEQQFRIRASYCKNRHCEPCQKTRGNRLAANLRDRLKNAGKFDYRFITLTLNHTDTPLREQIDKLYASFKKLRNTKMWKGSQKGGCAILEVKWSPDTAEWHPHLHIIAQGEHLAKQRLSDAWHECTGDSYIVDIRLIASEKDAAHYVAKYVSKGTVDAVWYNGNAAIEWITAMKGTRTAATFGTWRGFKLMEITPDTKKWETIGSVAGIYKDAAQGERYALRILQAIERDLQYNPHRKREKKIQPNAGNPRKNE